MEIQSQMNMDGGWLAGLHRLVLVLSLPQAGSTKTLDRWIYIPTTTIRHHFQQKDKQNFKINKQGL
jgi:hypothetical protein